MSATRLGGVLAAGGFAVTAELGPPRDPDAAVVRAAGRALRDHVTAVNVTDNPAATVKMSPVACAALLLDEGLEPILQLTSRDRNLMALQAELLGAWALGVRSVLALGGDPVTVGVYDGLAAEVRDVDAAGLARVITGLNAGRLAAGELLEMPTGFLIIGAANPLVDAPDRLRASPNVPTMAELGLKEVTTQSWSSIMVPAGTPTPVVDRLAAAAHAAMTSERVRTHFEKFGTRPMTQQKAEMIPFIEKEIVRWRGVIERAGLEKQ